MEGCDITESIRRRGGYIKRWSEGEACWRQSGGMYSSWILMDTERRGESRRRREERHSQSCGGEAAEIIRETLHWRTRTTQLSDGQEGRVYYLPQRTDKNREEGWEATKTKTRGKAKRGLSSGGDLSRAMMLRERGMVKGAAMSVVMLVILFLRRSPTQQYNNIKEFSKESWIPTFTLTWSPLESFPRHSFGRIDLWTKISFLTYSTGPELTEGKRGRRRSEDIGVRQHLGKIRMTYSSVCKFLSASHYSLRCQVVDFRLVGR